MMGTPVGLTRSLSRHWNTMNNDDTETREAQGPTSATDYERRN